MKKKQDDETKVYLVYDEELDQFVLKKGDDCTILEVLDLKDPGTEKLISILIKALEHRLNSIYKTDETVRRIFRSGGTSRIYLKSWT